MLLESPALPDSLKRAHGTRDSTDRRRLPLVRDDEHVADNLQRLVDGGQEFAFRGPLAEAEEKLLRFAVCHPVGDVLVISVCLGEEGSSRQVLDQIQQQTPVAPTPEFA